MNVLGIIPARGGSKGIPRKNLALLCGKPLIEYTLTAASASRLSEIVVSTDSAEIAATVEPPWHRAWVVGRPEELATDATPTIDVLLHALKFVDEQPAAIMCLQPTCPLRRTEDIDGAIELMERTNCDSVVSYVSVGASHPARMAVIEADNRVRPNDTGETFLPRQELRPVYIRSGDIYLTKTDVLLGGSMVGKDQRAWVIPENRWVNVDTPDDLAMAAVKMERLHASGG